MVVCDCLEVYCGDGLSDCDEGYDCDVGCLVLCDVLEFGGVGWYWVVLCEEFEVGIEG